MSLNNYVQMSVGKQRLANLALIHIHYNKEIGLEEVVDKYMLGFIPGE